MYLVYKIYASCIYYGELWRSDKGFSFMYKIVCKILFYLKKIPVEMLCILNNQIR